MIPRLVIDTSAYSALFSGNTEVADILAESEAIILPSVVIGELLDGFLGGSREKQNREDLSRFREKSRTAVVPVTDETAEWFAEIKHQLRRKGEPIPINDVWIAACAMQHGATLLSLDRHFEHIDGLLGRTVTGGT